MRPLALTVFALATGACATSGAIPQPFPTPGGPQCSQPVPAPEASRAQPGAPDARSVRLGVQDGYAISGTALSLRGAPYRESGNDPGGFDCSGLVWYVFGQHGLRVPRTVAEQYRAGSAVDRGDLQAGDLVFFNTKGAGASHVGISIGGDEFVHAPTARGEVRTERLQSTYWAGRYVGARRIK
jgi:cell wall-associated NlpC family hydrolase